jgi:hypothetical protein
VLGTNFLEEFERKRDRKEIERFFADLGLPMPQDSEFYTAVNGGRNIVFLSDYGFTVQVAHKNKVIDFDSPGVLRPLYARVSKNLKMWIDPGVECPVTSAVATALQQRLLETYNINVYDGTFANFGYIPKSNPRFPVLIDLDRTNVTDLSKRNVTLCSEGLRVLSESVRRIKEGLPLFCGKEKRELDEQDEAYGVLYKLSVKAFDEHRGDPTLRAAFFAACRDYKEDGRLLSSWDDFDYRNIKYAAKTYKDSCNLNGHLRLS